MKKRRKGEADSLGGEQVEGRQAVAELLGARRRPVRDVWLADDLDPAPVLGQIIDRAERLRVPVRRVPTARLEGAARTDSPQGVLAHAAPLPEADFDELCRAGPKGPPLLLLHGDQDQQMPVNQSLELFGAYNRVKAPVQLEIVSGAAAL